MGFVTHAIYEVLPRALRLLRAAHPQLDVALREMSNAEQVDALEGGRIDIALLHPPVSVNAKVNELRLGEEPMVAALPADTRWRQDGRVLAEIAQHGLVWFPEQQIPALRSQLLGAFRRAGHACSVVQDANRTLTVLACVAAGLGWSLLPRSVHALRHEGVRYAEVRDGADLPAFELAAMWLARSRPTFADAFAELLQSSWSLLSLASRLHFASSARRNASSSAGVEPMTSAPIASSRERTSGSCSTAASSFDSRSTIGAGVPAGTKTPFHSYTS